MFNKSTTEAWREGLSIRFEDPEGHPFIQQAFYLLTTACSLLVPGTHHLAEIQV